MRMLEKLKSKAGASMIVALIFFLVCVTVGGVVLTAASVNAGKTRREQASYQRRLALSSAARLLAEDIGNTGFCGAYRETVATTTTVTTVGEGDEAVSTTTVTESDPVAERDGSTGFFGDGLLLTDETCPALEEVYYGTLGLADLITGAAADQASCALEFPADENRGIPAVTGAVRLDGSYKLTVELAVVEDGEVLDALTLTFLPAVSAPAVTTEVLPKEPGDTTATQSVVRTASVRTTTVTWNDPQIRWGITSVSP